jgi:hypothetical protein
MTGFAFHDSGQWPRQVPQRIACFYGRLRSGRPRTQVPAKQMCDDLQLTVSVSSLSASLGVTFVAVQILVSFLPIKFFQQFLGFGATVIDPIDFSHFGLIDT